MKKHTDADMRMTRFLHAPFNYKYALVLVLQEVIDISMY